MSLKAAKIIYRITTLALALFILPGLFFMNSEMAVEGMRHVGLIDAIWLQQLVGWASPVAILAILIPKIPNHLKERAYAGLAFVYIGAFWAHASIDGFGMFVTYTPVITFAILMISHCMWHKIKMLKAMPPKATTPTM